MYISKILLIVFYTIFIQICKTERVESEKLSTAKFDKDFENCYCYPRGETLYPELMNPQNNGIERIVVYIYRDVNTNQIKIFKPISEKQEILPNIPVDVNDELKTVTTETIASLINSIPDNVVSEYDMKPSGIDGNYIGLIPETAQNFNQYIPQFLNQQTYPQQYHQTNNDPQFYPIFFKVSERLPEDYSESIPYQLVSPLKPYRYINPGQVNLNTTNLYIDQWLNQQMKFIQVDKTRHDIQSINTGVLKDLLQKVLLENKMRFDTNGFIIDANGGLINWNNLELRLVPIGIPISYGQAWQGDLTQQKLLPYSEGILVRLLYPPKILGIIQLKDTYTEKTNLPIMKTPNVYTKHYYTTSGSEIERERQQEIKSSPGILSSFPNMAPSLDFDSQHPALTHLNTYHVSSISNGISPLNSKDDDAGVASLLSTSLPTLLSQDLTPQIDDWFGKSNEPPAKENNNIEEEKIVKIPNSFKQILKLNNINSLNNIKQLNTEEMRPGQKFSKSQSYNIVKNSNEAGQNLKHIASGWNIYPHLNNFPLPGPNVNKQSHYNIVHSFKPESELSSIIVNPSYRRNSQSQLFPGTTWSYNPSNSGPFISKPDSYLPYKITTSSDSKLRPTLGHKWSNSISSFNYPIQNDGSSLMVLPYINNRDSSKLYTDNEWTSPSSATIPPFLLPYITPKSVVAPKTELSSHSAFNLNPDNRFSESRPTKFAQWNFPVTKKINFSILSDFNSSSNSHLNGPYVSHSLGLQPISDVGNPFTKLFYNQFEPFGYTSSKLKSSAEWKESLEKSVNSTSNNLNKITKSGEDKSQSKPFSSSLPVTIVSKSIANMVTHSLQDGADNNSTRWKESEENITTIKTTEKTEDDKRDEDLNFRIIGGSAATGSGAPLSVKGRSGLE